ncbi:murein tripeptide amidase MpaA [Streptomyces sp. 1114.5]|uniref:M14 family metallopeptidase n=1 Tax=unclassified Streptomyces TaxID=2593676 RepID=UPI000BD1691E|nr:MULTISPECIES: M14 family metallopeptidase [unclassified Streptomyces]RKT19648.1 murein tripeptide amidase MpaA [Streptomyces sp. 1114.5]SOB85845.1 Murein tripeptide amidase MpaA [Streptomyces sp. 1331.2]
MPYLNITEVESAVTSLATAYPGLTELITLPEPSWEGRTAHALKIGAPAGIPKPCVMMIGGVHAREWGSCEILVHLAADLLEAHQNGTGLGYHDTTFTADQVLSLLRRLDLVIFPLVNPDGRLYSQTVKPMWRKNRNPHNNGSQSDPACVGVDLNRNYDFLFDFTTAFDPNAHPQVSTNPCDRYVYAGPSAFSEPETRNVRWLLDRFPRTRWFVDVHSYSKDMLYNWGDDENQSVDPAMNFRNHAFDGKRGLPGDLTYAEYIPKGDEDAAVLLAEAFCLGVHGVRGVTYKPMSGFHLYPTSGTSDDYVYSRHFVNPDREKVLGFTVEWGTAFHPPWAEMQEIVLEVDAGLVQFCLAAA